MASHLRKLRAVLTIGVLALTACTGTSTSSGESPGSSSGGPTSSAQVPGTPATGGILRVGLPENIATLDPHGPSAGIDRHVDHAIYDPLVDIAPDGSYVPVLAESWETPDASTYVFHLRQGVKFHDGTDFNADAVKFMVDRILDEETASPLAGALGVIDEVVVDDPFTVTFRLKEPFPGLLAQLADRTLVISPTAAEKWGSDYALHPVGTGPFEFVEFVQGSQITLTRFADYWATDADGNQLPYLDGLEFKILTDDAARLTSLRTGDVDVIERVVPKDVETIRSDSELVYVEGLGPGYNQLYLNTLRPPFDNKALRQALSYAVDRQAIHETIYLSTGQPGEAPIPPSSPYWDPSFEVYGLTANPEMVQQKLQEGGMPDGYEFDLEVFNSPLDIQMAELMAAQLSEAGITANIVPSESSALIDRLFAHEYATFRASYVGRMDQDVAFDNFKCDSGSNYMSYCNPDFDELLTDARNSLDEDERAALYREAQQILMEDAPLLVMHYEALGQGLRTNVQGYEFHPDGVLRFTTVYLSE